MVPDILADMGISPRTVEYLRERGHEAIHLREEGLQKLADPKILDKARKIVYCSRMILILAT